LGAIRSGKSPLAQPRYLVVAAQRGNFGCSILSGFRLFAPIFVVFVFAVLVVVVVLSSAPNDFLSRDSRDSNDTNDSNNKKLTHISEVQEDRVSEVAASLEDSLLATICGFLPRIAPEGGPGLAMTVYWCLGLSNSFVISLL